MLEVETEQVVAPVAPAPEPAPEAAPVIEPVLEDPEKEPGGDDPQAIRARKEYRLRRRLESELSLLQQEKIAATARMQTLEEFYKPKAAQPRVYTTQELQTAIDAGTITVVEAADYLAEQRSKATADRVLKEERQRASDESRTATAQQRIDSYVEMLPWLRDKTDSRRRVLETAYGRLMRDYELKDNLTTESLFLEKQFGSLDSLKAKARLDTDNRTHSDTHMESGRGGGDAPVVPKPGQKPDLAKMPEKFHKFWNATQTPIAEREKEAVLWLKREAAKK